MNPVISAVGLLVISNIFMTFAWYGHLKFKSTPLLIVIFISWGLRYLNICSKCQQIG
jgi:uncharacterized protein (DUF486 family)